ncbi:hypothetical protein RJT34_06069 [Clitoria ternatea]|uniref:Uncharacterized protein n=1 Tax=Clitoria ternatea TaxID=43366 RepID=A0AAN9K1B5_CLITE
MVLLRRLLTRWKLLKVARIWSEKREERGGARDEVLGEVKFLSYKLYSYLYSATSEIKPKPPLSVTVVK